MSEHPFGPAPPPPSPGYSPAPLQYAHPPPPLEYASATIPYESARGRARQVVIWMWVGCVVQLFALWPTTLELMNRVKLARGEEEPYAYRHILAASGASLLSSMVVLVAWIMWWMWVHRTYRNLRPLGADGLHYSPGWSVAYYFIPIIHLFRPFQALRETWRASDPSHEGGTSWQRGPSPRLVNWWWGMFLLSTVVAIASVLLELADDRPRLLIAASGITVFLVFFEIAMMLVQIEIAKRVTAMQEERAGLFGTVASAVRQYRY